MTKRLRLFIIFLFIFVVFVDSQYQIPSYYGFWSKNFFKKSSIQSGSFSIFQMHFQIDMNYEETFVYFVDKVQHCIISYNLISKENRILAGQCGKSGNQIGSLQSSYFKSPKSIAYYRGDPSRISLAYDQKVYVVRNQSCVLTDSECLISQQLSTTTLNLSNIRLSPTYNLFSINPTQQQYLFVADTLNYCIKRISMSNKFVQVVAGQCGKTGFVDGIKGYNLIGQPTNLGIDAKGLIYFYDATNQYLRRVNTNTYVQTLLNGACKQYMRTNQPNRKINTFEIKKMICYQSWIQTTTKSVVQHYFNDILQSICTKHSSQCPSQQ